ncbi:MAG: radical SAM protein [Nitrososphaeria archaeon]|nr:radical SAM protein [Nitrososphaeria archaeon]NIN53575.1 radical SAM protein [Nitrososphaeria archaeon]NIQ32362.1 radical SAM protein [Nitrososphaeria archaeon]
MKSMNDPCINDSTDIDLETLLRLSRERSWRRFGRRIKFYVPSFIRYENEYYRCNPDAFPSISITGRHCALRCSHCGGRILESMIPAPTPKRLAKVLRDIVRRGAVGCLISGGCLPDGSVPLGNFLDVLAEVRKESSLKMAVHTGFVDENIAGRLAEIGVDAALIDVIGSTATIREVYHLDASVEDYDRSLQTLHQSGVPLVPHVVVGLHYGELRGEFNSLRIIAKYNVSAVVIVALRPIEGTYMEDISPPSPEDIARILVEARLVLPDTPLVLGCARPLPPHRIRTDALAVESGVNGIAHPSRDAIKLAKALDLSISFSQLCCSQIYEDWV